MPPWPSRMLLLAAGEKGVGRMGKPLHFKGSTFHRVINDFMCQVPRVLQYLLAAEHRAGLFTPGRCS